MASRYLLCANHNINQHKDVLFYCDSSRWVWRYNLFVFRNDWDSPVFSREIGSDRMIGIKNPFKKNVLYRNIRFTTLKKKSFKVFIHTPLTRTRQLMSLRRLRQAEQNGDAAGEGCQCVVACWYKKSVTAIQRRFRSEYGHQPPTHQSTPFWDSGQKKLWEVSFVVVCVMNRFRDTMFFWLFIIRTPSVLFHHICSNFNIISIACLDKEVLFIKCCKMYVALNCVNRYFSLWQSERLETLQ